MQQSLLSVSGKNGCLTTLWHTHCQGCGYCTYGWSNKQRWCHMINIMYLSWSFFTIASLNGDRNILRSRVETTWVYGHMIVNTHTLVDIYRWAHLAWSVSSAKWSIAFSTSSSSVQSIARCYSIELGWQVTNFQYLLCSHLCLTLLWIFPESVGSLR